jgi:hypothetical protein
MDPSVLTVYKSPFPKIRLGKDGDGGYVFADIPNIRYNTLLSGGINDDVSFEDAFMKRYNCVNCYAFDNTISALPTHTSSIQFAQKNIGGVNDDITTNLHDIIDVNVRIFAKMDIEGSEYSWVRSLSEDHLNKFEQIVMEFHAPFYYNIALGMEIFTKLNKTHRLIHFHPNNIAGTIVYNGIIIPNTFEGTYLHNRYFQRVLLNTEIIPGPLDMKNVDLPDIEISHPPFVHKWSNPIFKLPQGRSRIV